MSDHLSPDSDYSLTKDAYKEQSLDHLPPSLILLRARLAAIESGKSKLVAVKTFDILNFEDLLIADRFIIFTPIGELKTHTDKKELNRDPDIGPYDLFYEIWPEKETRKHTVKKKLKEQ